MFTHVAGEPRPCGSESFSERRPTWGSHKGQAEAGEEEEEEVERVVVTEEAVDGNSDRGKCLPKHPFFWLILETFGNCLMVFGFTTK